MAYAIKDNKCLQQIGKGETAYEIIYQDDSSRSHFTVWSIKFGDVVLVHGQGAYQGQKLEYSNGELQGIIKPYVPVDTFTTIAFDQNGESLGMVEVNDSDAFVKIITGSGGNPIGKQINFDLFYVAES